MFFSVQGFSNNLDGKALLCEQNNNLVGYHFIGKYKYQSYFGNVPESDFMILAFKMKKKI